MNINEEAVNANIAAETPQDSLLQNNSTEALLDSLPAAPTHIGKSSEDSEEEAPIPKARQSVMEPH